MAAPVRLTKDTLRNFVHLRNMDTSQSASEDHYIRTNEDTSYSIVQIHPVYPDLILAVKQSSLEFYNAGTLAKAEGIAAEDLYTFKITFASFLPGGLNYENKTNNGYANELTKGGTSISNGPNGRRTTDASSVNGNKIGYNEPIVLFACDWKLEKSIFAYSVTCRNIVAKFTGHEEPITTLVASPVQGASTFVSGSYEGKVILWGPDKDRKTLVPHVRYKVPESDTGPVCAFDWSGKIFVVCTGLKVFFFSVENPMSPFKKLDLGMKGKNIIDICISPHGNGDITALRMNTGEVFILDSMETYNIIATIKDEMLKDIGKGGMNFSSDGLTLLIPSSKLMAVNLMELVSNNKRNSPLEINPVVLPLKEEFPVIARFLPGSACIITAGDAISVYQYKE